jgi:hypothetical protein
MKKFLKKLLGGLGIFSAGNYLTPLVAGWIPLLDTMPTIKTLAVGSGIVVGALWLWDEYVEKKVPL